MKHGWLGKVLRVIDVLSLAGALIAGIFALVTAFIVSYEVLSRAVFNAPTTYATEISTYFLLGIAFLGAAYGVRESGHVQMDVLVNRFSERWRFLLDAIASLFALIFALVLAWQGWVLMADSYRSSSASATMLQVPLFIPQLTLPVGGALLVLQLLARIIRDIEGVLFPGTSEALPREASRAPEEALSGERESR